MKLPTINCKYPMAASLWSMAAFFAWVAEPDIGIVNYIGLWALSGLYVLLGFFVASE